MSTTALALKEMDPEQMALIKRTVAAGATNDELALFLFDCQRRGVHPLDKLLHFTKRNGKYTPITSIDFLRTRAHETGQCAGISDAEFTGEPKASGFAARVIVKRIVLGHMAEFAATARWDEYKPQQNDFMWARMPHTMLGKCAEALALRKAFPQELAGLYTGDEMAQAGKADKIDTDTGEIIEQTAQPALPPAKPVKAAKDAQSYTGTYEHTVSEKRGAVTVWELTIDGQVFSTVNEQLATDAKPLEKQRVTVTYKPTAKGGTLLLSMVPAVAEPVAQELPEDAIAF